MFKKICINITKRVSFLVVNLRKLVNTLKQNKEENIEDEFSTSTQHNKDVNKSPVSVLKTRDGDRQMAKN